MYGLKLISRWRKIKDLCFEIIFGVENGELINYDKLMKSLKTQLSFVYGNAAMINCFI